MFNFQGLNVSSWHSVIDCWSDFILIRENILFNYFSLMKFLLWPRIHLNDPQALGKKSVLSCCWIEYVCVFKLVLFVDCVVQIFYVLDDFLSSSAIIWWEGSVEVLHYNWEIFHFFFEPYQFLLHVFWISALDAYVFKTVMFYKRIDNVIIMKYFCL